MNNVYDYLKWRGDLSLTERPFNEVDNLLLALLSYIDLLGIVPQPGEGDIALEAAAEQYFALRGEPEATEGTDAKTAVEWPWMFHLMSQTDRFRAMRLSCMVDILDADFAGHEDLRQKLLHRPAQLHQSQKLRHLSLQLRSRRHRLSLLRIPRKMRPSLPDSIP